ncbi:MAG: iron-sulfur cluster assembly scaffold protein, partial [Actinomycetota bacterium]
SGHGCSISQASASMMTIAVKGKPVADVRAVAKRFKQLMTIEEDDGKAPADIRLGDIEALQGVVKYPVRIKCAVLGWNTLLEGLDSART